MMIEVETISKRAQAEQFDGETIPAIFGEAASAIRWGAEAAPTDPGTVPRTVPVMWFPFDLVNGQYKRQPLSSPGDMAAAKPGDWIVRHPRGLLEVVAGREFRARFREIANDA